jgi:hypothetical protein
MMATDKVVIALTKSKSEQQKPAETIILTSLLSTTKTKRLVWNKQMLPFPGQQSEITPP